MFYVVDEDRMMSEINTQGLGKGRGVLNWFVNEKEGQRIFNLIFDVFGVKYLYRTTGKIPNTIDFLLKSYGVKKSTILGIADESLFEEEKEEEIVEVPRVDFDLGSGV